MGNEAQHRIRKTALVLTGATAHFNELLKEAIQPGVLKKLQNEGFTSLVLQAGHGHQYCLELLKDQNVGLGYPKLRAFDFLPSLHEEMRACQAKEGEAAEGLVITHAGNSQEPVYPVQY